ncbi:DUF4132 domain-containing protein [Dyella sp. GSA-30]|uniref:DUF4132 domain-containing protein n=1 Tax=Dyella sp. GSA-30 TaxID=2994496 RepID=UPI0024906450|nr:DUF4132 domain-containing protein [Dyella sp. GSA-30]BDU20049.1 hypothetical protein DYGSA30_15060 [Dyella sp. GSA-30]
MLKWIEKALGRPGENAPKDVANDWTARLKTWLAGLDHLPQGEGRAGLSADLLSYVSTGEPTAILGEAGQRAKVGMHLMVTGYHYGRRDRNDVSVAVYRDLDDVPPAMLLRWARLLEASMGSQANRFRIVMPDGSHWAEMLMMNSGGTSPGGWSSERPKAVGISANLMEALLLETGQPAAALLAACFATPVDSAYGAQQRLLMVTDIIGYAGWVERHAETLRPLLLPTSVQQRLHVAKMLEPVDTAILALFVDELAELAVSNSKQVRAAVEPLLHRCATAMYAPLKLIAGSGKPDQRVNALRLLWTLAQLRDDENLRSYARDVATADKAPSVQALVGEWASQQQAVEATERTHYDYEIPTIEWTGLLTPQVSARLDKLWQELNESVDRVNRQMRESHQAALAKGRNYGLHQDAHYTDDSLALLKSYIDSPAPAWNQPPRGARTGWRHTGPALTKLAGWEHSSPTLMFKTLSFFGSMTDEKGRISNIAVAVFNALHRATSRPTLIELAQIMDSAGMDTDAPFHAYCRTWSPLGETWSSDAVWPYFASRLEVLSQALGQVKDYYFDRSALFRAVASLPSPPPIVVNALFDLALGIAKSERLAAQEALGNLPGKEARIIGALADGKSEVREVAAQWLGRLRHAPAIPALEQAVEKEKHDLPKGAMLDALQALGRPVEKYLDRDKLAVEAAKSLSKGLPKDLEWFPWNALPAVRWDDSGEGVTVNVLRWMLVQAVKQKSAEPNAVLRKYCAMFEPRDRERFGQFVLENWLREDIKPIPSDEAMRRATSHAQTMHNWMQRSPQYYTDSPLLGKSVEELIAHYLPGFLRQPQASATGSKGVLAVAAACAGAGAADPVARFLKEYYGTRASQGKALIAMLAWIEHPTATQLMLSIGNRFRTKSFQEEATRQAEALADRNNWSLSELADRTMPAAGFDNNGTMELSYGERVFTARLMADFKVELFNPDGKKIASLPTPRQDDDADQAKEAKKAFSASKKSIKSIVELQTDRLYEALCTERDWSFDDWNTYLNRHPIVRRLLQRLVWVQMEGGVATASFRPLDDGTLTDCEDNEVTLPADARVRIAHDTLLAEGAVTQWQQHLADYEIVPLFQQLGKGVFQPSAEQLSKSNIQDFEGHMLETFALRGRALKLGYTRGAAEDGGWFYTYEKRFPTLGLTAIVQFTGGPLPEENRKVALVHLSFVPSGENHWHRNELALSKVPKILLSECYNDLRLIAAEGTGFDPDWQKKSEY